MSNVQIPLLSIYQEMESLVNIEIKNCNNIDNASIKIDKNKLNIKYAMNGTGKSTIARAIEMQAKGNGSIQELTPFKYIGSKDDKTKPAVSGIDDINSVAIFNELYINQFAFKQDEVVANSFEIFIKTADYDKCIDQIDILISEIKNTFKNSDDIDKTISDLNQLSDSFGKSKSGYSAASSLAKGIGNGNKVENIPVGLESYSDYLKSSENVRWLKWQMSGNDFINISNHCPYCTTPTETKKETILQVSKEYDAKSIEHLNAILKVLENLKLYFTDEANDRLNALSKNINGLSKEEIEYLLQVKTQVDTLKNKLSDLKGLTFFSFKDVDKALDLFNNLKIKIEFLTDLNSHSTKEIIQKINGSIDSVLSKIGVLQGEINKQKIAIQRTIEEHKKDINAFLKFAGYKYFVDVEFKDDTYKMRLRHQDYSQSVSNGTQHLSYGEKNAFSLVLFMYECLSKNPDIIILDDPISSFDRNKKYAVIDMLFRRKKSFKGKTVLMMTHDFEPVIDILYNLPHKFEPIPYVSFLELNGSDIKEIQITRSDISTFGQICEENIKNRSEDIIKLIYLRRYYEVINNKGVEYQLLSNLLHKREIPIMKESGAEIVMTSSEIEDATSKIKNKMSNFNYTDHLEKLSDHAYMGKAYNEATFNYEKLQIFRVTNKDLSGDDIIDKFINETFHIENEYVMQLNPCKYEIVPQYIIEKCDGLLNR